ncbi:MAG: FAD-dependent oxidoreductase [Pseudomonadota bacterium]
MNTGTLIVGAGQAGAQVASALRGLGYDESITLVGAERWGPYHRPPLSKAFLLADAPTESLEIRSDTFFRDNSITLVTGEPIERVDLQGQSAVGASGKHHGFDRLVLATGVAPVKLSVPGCDLPGVMYLGGLDDAIALKARLASSERLVVVGGGYIGLELAASARVLGKAVTVLEMADRLLQRVAPPAIGEFFLDLHRQRGVDVRLGTTLARIDGDERGVSAVELSSGERIEADTVVIGVGSRPQSALARQMGLSVLPSGAIEVDEFMQTSHARVLAVGDCAAAPDPAGRHARLQIPSIQSALNQARVAAATIAAKPQASAAIPWFWSDQYDIKLQIVGHGAPHDDIVVRGDPGTHRFSVFSYCGDKLASAAVINRPADFMQVRKCIEMQLAVDRTLIADESTSMADIFKAHQRSPQ